MNPIKVAICGFIIFIISVVLIGIYYIKIRNNTYDNEIIINMEESSNYRYKYLNQVLEEKGIKYKNNNRGIFINFEYNPNYFRELKIINYILNDILYYTKVDYYYDDDHIENSTMITIGEKNGYIISEKKEI